MQGESTLDLSRAFERMGGGVLHDSRDKRTLDTGFEMNGSVLTLRTCGKNCYHDLRSIG